MGTLAEQITDLSGASVSALLPVSGGDVADAYRVTLGDGRVVFAKTKQNAPEGFFSIEAAGLQWLDDAAAVGVARVIAVSDDEPPCLILAWIDAGGGRDAATELRFGAELAALHQTGASSFGRWDSQPTGSLRLPNRPCDTWTEFFSEQRLVPLAEIAARRGVLSGPTLDGLMAIAGRLVEFGAHDEPLARLHGDLWAGNRLVDTDGRSWLIDPAAHGGHREFDLAMMRIFGGFSNECFDAYDEVYPLADGWHERVALHQLAPLVVHAIKFGGSYVAAVDSAVSQLS